MTDLSILAVEVTHIKEKVDHIDEKLEALNLGSRLAVVEDRQNTIFKLVHGGFGFVGMVLGGIVIWLFTT